MFSFICWCHCLCFLSHKMPFQNVSGLTQNILRLEYVYFTNKHQQVKLRTWILLFISAVCRQTWRIESFMSYEQKYSSISNCSLLAFLKWSNNKKLYIKCKKKTLSKHTNFGEQAANVYYIYFSRYIVIDYVKRL